MARVIDQRLSGRTGQALDGPAITPEPGDAPSTKYAAVTLVTNPGYVLGAQVMGYSLRRSGWTDDMVAMIAPQLGDLYRHQLETVWSHLVEVQEIPNPHPPEVLGQSSFQCTYTKLRVWERTAYERVLFIDADMLILGSVHQLLEASPEFAAAPCATFPDLFNSGFMIVRPSIDMFAMLMEAAPRLPSYDGSDQGFLNSYFSDWYTGPAERRLPFKFNTPYIHSYYAPVWRRFQCDPRVLHFWGPEKPWRIGRFRARLMRWAYTFISGLQATPPYAFDQWHDLRAEMERALVAAPEGRLRSVPAAL